MRDIEQIIHALGIHGTYHGYRYLVYAIRLALENEDYLLLISKWLYPDVAAKFHTSTSSVERNIRTVINYCWDHGNRRLLQELASYPLEHKPSTGEFLDILVTYFKSEGKESRRP